MQEKDQNNWSVKLKIKPYMNKGRFHIIYLVIIPLLLGLFSCKTTRKVIKAPIKEEGADYLFGQLKKNEMKFEWLTARFTATYIEDKKKISFRGQMRIKRDSIIWISISPALGIEMVRLIITNDSIKFLDRIKATYQISDFNYINRFINSVLDFDMLQAFLIGNDFSFFENGKFKASIDGMEYRLLTVGRRKLKKYVKSNREDLKIPIQNIWLNYENFKITKVMIKEVKQDGRKLQAFYSDFNRIDNQLFPHHLDFQIASENKIDIGIDYLKIIVDKPMKFPFKIPERYTEVQ